MLIVKRPVVTPESPPRNKFNPFQPEMPRIPGVSDGSRHANPELNNPGSHRMPQIVAIAAVVLLVSAAILWWSRSKSRSPSSASVDPEITEQTSPAPATLFSNPIPPAHEGPTSAGTVEEL